MVAISSDATVRLGSIQVIRLYLGTVLVWQPPSPGLGFGVASFGTSPFGGSETAEVTGYGVEPYGAGRYGV